MKKLLKSVLAGAMALTMTACSGGTTEPDAPAAAKIAKAGLGINTSVNAESGQINTTFAVVGLDAEGKIVDVAIDVAQTTPGPDALTITKKDRKEDYGMQVASSLEKGEWYQQIAALEAYLVGKTADEVAAIPTEVKDEHHDAVPAAGSDLAAGCTMNIGDFKATVAKAVANAVDVQAEAVKVGHVMEVSEEQMDLTVNMVAVDAEGKIVASKLDVAQIKSATPEETRTKVEKEGDYGMQVASSLEKGEWFQQAAAWDAYIVGKTAADVAAIETYAKDDHHNAVPAEGSDLAAGCTMNVGSFKEAVANALN